MAAFRKGDGTPGKPRSHLMAMRHGRMARPHSGTQGQPRDMGLQISITATDLILLMLSLFSFLFVNIHVSEQQKFKKSSAKIEVRWVIK